MRIAFLSDFHVGSHAGDVPRLERIVGETARFAPDLVLYGGDYVNLAPIGGGRVPPETIAALLARLEGAQGRFAILGNHDYIYGREAVAGALRQQGIVVLEDERGAVTFDGTQIEVLGLPDAEVERPEPPTLLAALDSAHPTIVLSHDPMWFADQPAGPHLMLAGHTHGGQVRLPLIGPVTNQSKAPLRWTHGLIVEEGRHLYVTAGLGTSMVPIRIGIPPEIVILDLTGR